MGRGERGVDESSGSGVTQALKIDVHARAMPRHRGWQSVSLILKVAALDLSHPLLVSCSKTCGTDSGNIPGQTHDKRCEFALLVTSPI